jgi:hypothetical protein
MKKLPIIFIAFLTWTGCHSYERIYIDDVELVVSNQLENNVSQINDVERELRQLSIDSIKKNIALLKGLKQLHSELITVYDSIDRGDRNQSLSITENFIKKWFEEHLWIFNDVPLKLTDETPRPILKLRLAMLEGYYIVSQKGKYAYDDDSGSGIQFDGTKALIIVDNHLIKKGEKVTGQIVMAATSTMTSSPTSIRRVMVNGQVITAGKDGWRFEFIPKTNKSGIVEYELDAQISAFDTLEFRGHGTVYIRD